MHEKDRFILNIFQAVMVVMVVGGEACSYTQVQEIRLFIRSSIVGRPRTSVVRTAASQIIRFTVSW